MSSRTASRYVPNCCIKAAKLASVLAAALGPADTRADVRRVVPCRTLSTWIVLWFTSSFQHHLMGTLRLPAGPAEHASTYSDGT